MRPLLFRKPPFRVGALFFILCSFGQLILHESIVMKRNLLLIAFIHFFLALQASPFTAYSDRLLLQQPPGPDAFITTWQTATDGDSITIPVNAHLEGYNYSVDWGDGNVSNNQTSSVTHVYATAGEHVVAITGMFPAIQFSNSASDYINDSKLKSVDQWGTQVWSGMDAAFSGCSSLTTVPNSPGPVFAPGSTLYSMFSNCTVFNADLNSWDLSNVREISFMFSFATQFNGNISSWNVSNVTNMQNMFQRASSFNGDIGNWQVTKVTLMDGMFSFATAFNGNISTWDVSSVVNMAGMFMGASSFDQQLGDWQMQRVNNTSSMLDNAGLSPNNYETALAGWSTQNVQDSLVLGVEGLHYCAATGRQSLIDDHGWTIGGDKKTCLVTALPDNNGVVYVDSSITTPGDGSSWNKALKHLSNAVVTAQTNLGIKEIHIAKGTYFPTGDPNSTDRDSSFVISRANLKVLGGYASGGGSRDIQNNITTLSGDVGVTGDSADNNFHVMVVSSIVDGVDSVIIDGITFTAGMATGSDGSYDGASPYGYSQGGGLALFNVFRNTVVSNCTFIRNYAESGSGMIILGNTGGSDGGGTPEMASPLISNCLFVDNGAIAVTQSSLVGGIYGGAICIQSASPVIWSCDFIDNKSLLGGAIMNVNYGSPIIAGSTFMENKAAGMSAIANLQGGNPLIANCLITNNLNIGFPVSEVPEALRFYENSVLGNMQYSKMRIINSTIAQNHVEVLHSGSAGIINVLESELYITNSVIWGNDNTRLLDSANGSSKVAYSLVQGLDADVNNHILDGHADVPFFADTANGDFRLNLVSPGLNAGLNDSITGIAPPFGSTDLDGRTRLYGAAVDLGAFELQRNGVGPDTHGVLYVDSAAAPGGDGSSWSAALSSLDSALYYSRWINLNKAAISSGPAVAQVWVAGGTYQPAAGSAFSMLPTVKLFGSFAGTESVLSDRDYNEGYTSILKGNGNSVVRNDNNGLDESSVLDGFKITGGSATGASEQGNGGGIYNFKAAPTYSHLDIQGNYAVSSGGGMAVGSSDPAINNVTLQGNTAGDMGGALFIDDATDMALYNLLIFKNSAKNGGGVYSRDGLFSVTNATVTQNTASLYGGGIATKGSGFHLNNSIVWGNDGQDIGNELYFNNSDIFLNSSLYKSGAGDVTKVSVEHYYATDTISADPLFINAANYDFALMGTSPAINAGDNAVVPFWDTTDLAGGNRIVDVVVDLGAIEYAGASLPVKMSPLKGIIDPRGHAVLKWSTFTELQNKGFEVQWSTDGVHFVHGYFAPSLATNGNSSSRLDYNYDAGEISGVKYYRLQQTDLNGHITHSNTIRLQASRAAFHLTAFPNPTRNFITVHVGGTMGLHPRVMVIGLSGRVLKTQQLSGNDLKVDLTTLASGIYLIKYMDDQQSSVIRIIKQ